MSSKTSSNLIARPPVITIMGHIDHGKSTLLDYIRKSNVAATEAGGITQHLSAYEVEHVTATGKKSTITFLDTPGHAAFQSMRARGATVADIAILVVSAEDGVKTQTLEALKTILAAKVPYIVAINKIDKPNADVNRTKQTLAEAGVYVEGYGGDIPVVPISAKTGEGIPDLLDMMLLVAELADLKGDPEKSAEGFVIEANLDSKKGITATLIIKDGTMKSGQFVGCDAIAPTRILENFAGKKITEATFSSPVRVVGFDALPAVGSAFFTFDSKKEAESCRTKTVTTKATFAKLDEENPLLAVVPVVVKADTSGTIDALVHELKKGETDRVKINIIESGIGSISEKDVKIASGNPSTLLVGFNVKVDGTAKEQAERLGLEIKTFDIIYKVTEWVLEMATSRTPREMVPELKGKAKVLKYFSSVKNKHVIGCRIEEGRIASSDDIKLSRRGEEIATCEIKELQRNKEKVGSVEAVNEFGCQIECPVPPAPGDYIECFTMVER